MRGKFQLRSKTNQRETGETSKRITVMVQPANFDEGNEFVVVCDLQCLCFCIIMIRSTRRKLKGENHMRYQQMKRVSESGNSFKHIVLQTPPYTPKIT